ncbi:MAG TPA: hypothetical protein VI612_02140 [Candidatus Nanoarchaeia archaeon]|nr:hypothetical protein [Candidatus Nanoarchaeia archaeon]
MAVDVQAEYNTMLKSFYEGLLSYLQEKRRAMGDPNPDNRKAACGVLHQMIMNGCRTLNQAEYRDPAFFTVMGAIARNVGSLVSIQYDTGAERIISDTEARIRRLDLDRIVNKL